MGTTVTSDLVRQLTMKVRVGVNIGFDAREHFQVDPSLTSRARIMSMSDEFRSRYVAKVEEGRVGRNLLVFTLDTGRAHLTSGELIELLGGKEAVEITLFDLFWLLSHNRRGSGGVFGVDGNICYIEDVYGKPGEVSVYWHPSHRGFLGGWSLNVHNPGEKDLGDQDRVIIPAPIAQISAL